MLTYSFEGRGELSLYEHLYRCMRRDIESGRLAPGDRLPSKRSFARNLGVSVITVEGAYAQLVAEGYVRSEARKGYYVEDVGAQAVEAVGQGVPVSATNVRPATGKIQDASGPLDAVMQDAGHLPFVADLTGQTAPMGLFPYGAWAKAVRETLANEPERELVGGGDAQGVPRLRDVLADHLWRSRGMRVDPACIVVGAGSQLLDLLVVQLLGRDVRYAVEDPGYPRVARIYEKSGMEVCPIGLDAAGVRMGELRASGANVLHLMPSHHFPTGLVTTIGRRYELLGWASETLGRYLIEDDYDSEFRLSGRPIPALQSIDVMERVIYLNTFTKSLGPAFRIAYMVLPPHLVRRYREELGFYSSTVSAIDQLALARFIEHGHFERHVNRMRAHYREIRDALIEGLRQSSLSGRIRVEAPDSGIHFVLVVSDVSSEGEASGRLRELGIRLRPLSAFRQRIHEPANDGIARFVISYSSLEKAQVEPCVQAMEQALS